MVQTVAFDDVAQTLEAPQTNSIDRHGLQGWEQHIHSKEYLEHNGGAVFTPVAYKQSSVVTCCYVYQGDAVDTYCCCQQYEGKEVAQAMVAMQTRQEVSCFERYLLCGQNIIDEKEIIYKPGTMPTRRGEHAIPDKLNGVFFEGGKYGIGVSGMVGGLASWNPNTRTVVVKQYGPGVWAYPGAAAASISQLEKNCLRICNPAYKFVFEDADLTKAQIIPLMNPLGCCCLPFIEPFCPIPSYLVDFRMVEADKSVNGNHWHRASMCCPLCFEHFQCCRKEPTPKLYQKDILKAQGWGGRLIDGKMPLFGAQYELYKIIKSDGNYDDHNDHWKQFDSWLQEKHDGVMSTTR